MNQDISYLTLADRKLAYQQRIASSENAHKAGVVFLGGLASDMTGTKASFLDQKCAQAGLAFTRFDYRGHGASSDEFINGCIGDWADDTIKLFENVIKGPQVLVGSSLGGWISMLLMRQRPEMVAGFVGVAAAPDFTDKMIEPILTEDQKTALADKGVFYEGNDHGDPPLPITQKLLDDGNKQSVLDQPTVFDGPVHLFQGQNDTEVPWAFATRIAANIISDDIKVTLVKAADHRFSRPQDLDLVWSAVDTICSSTLPYH